MGCTRDVVHAEYEALIFGVLCGKKFSNLYNLMNYIIQLFAMTASYPLAHQIIQVGKRFLCCFPNVSFESRLGVGAGGMALGERRSQLCVSANMSRQPCS